MIIAKCPVRISLVGGSTDLDAFLLKYGYGSVISFSSDISVRAILFKDKLGYNGFSNRYVISYSEKEIVPTLDLMNNELVKECLRFFDIPPINCWLTSDVHSSGTGLATSSAYCLALARACAEFKQREYSNYDLSKLALGIERTFNPLTGQQDPYGCALGGFNRIHFYADKDPVVEPLSQEIFKSLKMYLVPTNIKRNSQKILSSINPEKSFPLLKKVDQMKSFIDDSNTDGFLSCIRQSWDIKKNSNPLIMGNSKLMDMDNFLNSSSDILAHRLCGAGGGGYFLIFASKSIEKLLNENGFIHQEINIDQPGLTCVRS